MSKLTMEALGHNILPPSWRRSAIISVINPLPSPGPLVTCSNPACRAASAVFRPTAYTANDLNDMFEHICKRRNRMTAGKNNCLKQRCIWQVKWLLFERTSQALTLRELYNAATSQHHDLHLVLGV